MPATRVQRHRKALLLAVATAASVLLFGGCTVREQRGEKGEKKVEVQTPFANIKVNTDAKAEDTGLPVYPGARVKPGSGDDHHSANVNISAGMFALKVAVVKYESDDAPDKIVGFYRDKLKKFPGTFVECDQTSWVTTRGDRDSDELTCDKGRHGDAIELKAGTPDRQHIVAVKPNGSGSEFALVYVQKHGKEGEL
jgi:hypothetical protein